jgi:hypothetical protein
MAQMKRQSRPLSLVEYDLARFHCWFLARLMQLRQLPCLTLLRFSLQILRLESGLHKNCIPPHQFAETNFFDERFHSLISGLGF